MGLYDQDHGDESWKDNQWCISGNVVAKICYNQEAAATRDGCQSVGKITHHMVWKLLMEGLDADI